MLQITILSLSFFTIMTSAALSTALTAIAASYPGVARVWIQSLVTVPALVFMVLLPILNRLPGTRKQHVQVGLALYLVGGLLPVLPLSFGLLILARALAGVALSLIAGPAISLITDYFHGATRRQLLGWANAVTAVGTISATLLAGWLALRNWHWAFGIYGLAVVPLVLITRFLPAKTPVEDAPQAAGRRSGALRLTFGLLILLTGIYFVIPTDLPFYIGSVLHTPNPAAAGWLLASVSGLGLVIGIGYGKLPWPLAQKFELTFASLLLGMLAMIAGRWPLTLVGLGCAGVAMGLGMPALNERIAQLSAPAARARNLTVTNALMFGSQFASPLVFAWLEGLVGGGVRAIFALAALGAILPVVLVFLMAPRTKQSARRPG